MSTLYILLFVLVFEVLTPFVLPSKPRAVTSHLTLLRRKLVASGDSNPVTAKARTVVTSPTLAGHSV